MVGLLRYGGIPGVLAAGKYLSGLEHSPITAERRLVAQVIGEVKAPNFYRPLLALLQDEDLSVRQAALLAAGQVEHPKLLPLIIDNEVNGRGASANVRAVVRSPQPAAREATAGDDHQ